MRLAAHVAHMGEMKNAQFFFRKTWREETTWILKKLGARMWTGFIWLRKGSSGELLGTR